MRIVQVKLKSATAYSQSKIVDPDVFPKKEKEDAASYDARLWREKSTYNEAREICIPAMALKMSIDEAVKRLNMGIPGRGKSTYTKFFTAGQICDADVPIGVSVDDVPHIDIWANADGVRGSGKRVRRRFPGHHEDGHRRRNGQRGADRVRAQPAGHRRRAGQPETHRRA